MTAVAGYMSASEHQTSTGEEAHAISFIKRGLLGLLFLQSLLTAYFYFARTICGEDSCSEQVVTATNVSGQIFLMVICGITCYRLSTKYPQSILTPSVVYAAQTAIFFGFGPLAYYFSNEMTQYYLTSSIFAINSHELLRANLLSNVGITSCLLGMVVTISLIQNFRKRRIDISTNNYISPEKIAILFIVIGLLLKFLFILPVKFRLVDYVLPGAINNLHFLADLGFATMAYVITSKRKNWRMLFWTVWIAHFSIILLEFQKLSLVVSILLPAIGGYLGHRNIYRLSIWMVSLAVIYVIYQPIALQGRVLILSETGSIHKADLPTRFRHMLSIGQMETSVVRAERLGISQWWTRLTFSGEQVTGMEYYDSGKLRTFHQSPLIYFIPRFIWKDKPTVISSGKLFYSQVTENTNNWVVIHMSVYGDGYWQMGWVGVILFSIIMGIYFGIMSYASFVQLYKKMYIYLPTIFLSIYVAGPGPNKFFFSEIISSIPIYVAYTLLIMTMNRITYRRMST